MRLRTNCTILILAVLTGWKSPVFPQEQTVDRIIAVVEGTIILQSALESQYFQMVSRGDDVTDETRCKIVEELLFQKLLYSQAKKDSVTISESQVESEIDRRMRYFMGYFGSEEKFKEFYGKTPDEYKEEIRDDIRELLLAKNVNDKITGDVKVSPAEVKAYFESIPADSIPFINSEVEVGIIVKKAPVSVEAKKHAREKAESIRLKVTSGSDFIALQRLYSEDPAVREGMLVYENIQRGSFVPEFDAVAFKMNENDISEVIETAYGFHVIQLLKRKGEFVDLRHILIIPKTGNDDLQKAKNQLDSIYNVLMNDTVNFSDLAGKFSDDEETKINGGLLVNPNTGSSTFSIEELGQLDPNMVFAIDKMKVGEVSKPVITMTRDAKQAYKIIYLKSRTEPHKANLNDDYQRIQNITKALKEEKLMRQWIEKKLPSTYIRIVDDYKTCNYVSDWNQVKHPPKNPFGQGLINTVNWNHVEQKRDRGTIRYPAWFTPSYADEINGIALGLFQSFVLKKEKQVVNGVNIDALGALIYVYPFYWWGAVRQSTIDSTVIFTDNFEFVNLENLPETRGVRINGFFGFSGKTIGLDISAAGSYNIIFKGVSVVGGFFRAAQMKGITISGWSYCLRADGFQMGIGGTYATYIRGAQVGVLFGNRADYLRGVQLSPLFNIARKEAKGIQIGLVNYAKKLNGIQIGLINISGRRVLPLINWSGKKNELK